ncbi:MAG: 3-dehydroquinate synthase [Oscillospiraceae bacterium]|nr:3-dehydroquinate synthase [Oscillospiraceae bacterium]
MKTIQVNTSHPYKIFIEQGLLEKCGQIVSELMPSGRCAIITDDIVDSLYSTAVTDSLKKAGLTTVKFVFKNGESSKCSENLNNIYTFLAKNHITRSDCLIALGGGVVGDITGFAAATFLRGIKYIQIPTTLLAQIDSSVGGKTAIDLPEGKNLVGAFKQPLAVICDPLTLTTLTPAIASDGMAEAIKYGMIRSRELFDLIASHTTENYIQQAEEIISRCVTIKAEIVCNDEFDTGERMLLNFGHTLAHAVESYYHYETYTHGSAVAIGMYVITKHAAMLGICTDETLSSLSTVIRNYNLPVLADAPMNELIPLCLNDKKRESDYINIIICDKIGSSYISKMPISKFYEFMDIQPTKES